jgi:hypothetical protein
VPDEVARDKHHPAGIPEPPHSFGGSLLPPATHASRKARNIYAGGSPSQPPPSAMKSPQGRLRLPQDAQLNRDHRRRASTALRWITLERRRGIFQGLPHVFLIARHAFFQASPQDPRI